jgi:tRNA(fMet)-specific endonuclease VapC
MPRFMLDADTVSYAIRGEGRVAARLLQHRPSELCLSSITLAELEYGAEAKRSRKLKEAILTFVKDVEVVPFDRAASDEFAVIAAALARKGRPFGVLDSLLAAHARSLGVAVVTNNLKHFRRVPGLAVESWA